MLFTKDQIQACIDIPQVIRLIQEGFALYSKGETVVPPFGSLHFDDPKGEAHIKYGYAKGQEFFVVKIASNFPGNKAKNKPSGQGVMLVFSKLSGELKAVLNDEGYLTDIRTAAAGAVAARHLAPKNVRCIGIVGNGTQAFYQLLYLKEITVCRDVIVWGRNLDHLTEFISHPELTHFKITPTQDMFQLGHNCNLIVTTTSSQAPLLFTEHILPGTHITAVGADDQGKQEVDALLFKRADIIAVDSRSQCFSYGDSAYALQRGVLEKDKVVELGEIIVDPSLGRTSEAQITIADLTGVAIQDIQIATAVLSRLNPHNN